MWLMPSQPSPLAIAEDVPDVPVTLSLKDADPDSAVQLVLRQAALAEPALQWSKENGRLSVSLRKEGEGPPRSRREARKEPIPRRWGPRPVPANRRFPGSEPAVRSVLLPIPEERSVSTPRGWEVLPVRG